MFEYLDKNGDGSVSVAEMKDVFKEMNKMEFISQKDTLNIFGRQNLMYIIKKSYQSNIDIQKMLKNKDEYNDGTISRADFINVL